MSKEHLGLFDNWRYSPEFQIVTQSPPGMAEGDKLICDLSRLARSNQDVRSIGLLLEAAPMLLEACEAVLVASWQPVPEDAARMMNDAVALVRKARDEARGVF